jgi:hypothetical protein
MRYPLDIEPLVTDTEPNDIEAGDQMLWLLSRYFVTA